MSGGPGKEEGAAPPRGEGAETSAPGDPVPSIATSPGSSVPPDPGRDGAGEDRQESSGTEPLEAVVARAQEDEGTAAPETDRFTIAPAQPRDAPAIAALWTRFTVSTAVTFDPDARSAADVLSMMTARGAAGQPFLCLQDNEGVAGIATYGAFRGGRGYAHTAEQTILLDARARGAGQGRRLAAMLEAHAREAGIRVLVAAVSSENPDGLAFHRAIGFTGTAVLPQVGHKFGRWMDLHLMHRILSP